MIRLKRYMIALFCFFLLVLVWFFFFRAYPEAKVVIDEKPFEIEPAPIVKNQIAYVPLRSIDKIIGSPLVWKEGTKEVALTYKGNTLCMNLEDQQTIVNGREQTMPERFIYQDVTMVPLRYISEMFDISIDWDQNSKTVYLHTDELVNKPYQIAFLPLDNRPINLSGPIKSAYAAGMELVTPNPGLLGSIDQPGNTKELETWLEEVKHHVDAFILSADMLAYGGLVPSRTNKVSLEEALQRIEAIKQLKNDCVAKPVFVHNSIQRLAITATNQDDVIHYNNVREWAILYDKVHHFGQKELLDQLLDYEQKIPPSIMEEYQKSRLRNHTINLKLLEFVQNGYIDYLVLSMDDAAEYGLQRIEKEAILNKITELGIEDKVYVYAGTDENGFVLLGKLATQIYKKTPTVYVHYIGFPSRQWIADYEDVPLEENVEKHLKAMGAEQVDDPELADIHFHIYYPDVFADEDELLSEGVEAVTASLDAHKYTIVAEIDQTKNPRRLIRELKNINRADELFSYAAWNTAGNTVGTVAGHAVARFAFLHGDADYGETLKSLAAENHVEFLLHRYVKDNGYKMEIINMIRDGVQSSGGDVWKLDREYDLAQTLAWKKVLEDFTQWKQNFSEQGVFIEMQGEQAIFEPITDYELTDLSFPWGRLFEAEITIEKNKR